MIYTTFETRTGKITIKMSEDVTYVAIRPEGAEINVGYNAEQFMDDENIFIKLKRRR